jgi:hypothetical protein
VSGIYAARPAYADGVQFRKKPKRTGTSHERNTKVSASGGARRAAEGYAENDRSAALLFSFKLTIDFPVRRGYNSANNEIPTKPLRKRSTLTKPGVRELPAV